ncbi:hypothetical protein ES705_39600 [subsurface metagenome]
MTGDDERQQEHQIIRYELSSYVKLENELEHDAGLHSLHPNLHAVTAPRQKPLLLRL